MKTKTRKQDATRLQELALKMDAAAMRMVRGRPAIDVALGEIFLRMAEGGHIDELCFSKKTDFANEALGIPPRTFFSLSELASGLRERPLLKQAVLSGEVSAEKARTVMKLAVGEDEGAWVAAAVELTGKDLKEAVRKRSGAEEEGEPWRMRTIRYRMTVGQQDRLDYAHSLAKEIVGYDAPGWKLTEAIAREWLARSRVDGGGVDGGGTKSGNVKEPVWLEEMTRRSDEVARQLRAVFEAGEVVEQSCCGVTDENALGLLAQAKRLLERRERFDEPLGRVLLAITRDRLWWWLAFDSFGDYCRERLGISRSTARQRIRLERRLVKLPALREAMKAGRITYSKALLISRDATPLDVDQRIREAASTTWQQVNERAEREEREAERANEEIEVEGPEPSVDVVTRAVRDARRQILALGEEKVTEGEAMAHIADHFVKVYEVPLGRAEWRNEWQKSVLVRHGGLCAVPGCTRAARDNHHITFRSKNGPDEPFNCLAVCWCHHKRCIHKGLLLVRGRGGEYLVWKFVDATLTPWAEFVTVGDDDVRVVGVGLDGVGTDAVDRAVPFAMA